MNKNEIHAMLLEHQCTDIQPNERLSYKDLLRLSKFINGNFFTENCCIWSSKKSNISRYITFFHSPNKGESFKKSLTRLLWRNFVGYLYNNETVQNMCGVVYCCNINHYVKYSYVEMDTDSDYDADDEN